MRNSRNIQLKKCDMLKRRWGTQCAKEAFDCARCLVKKKDFGLPEVFSTESLPRLIAPKPNITLPIERRY